MAVLGVRCSNKDIAYCVLDGDKVAPTVTEAQLLAYPKGFSEPETLQWLHQEVAQVLGRHDCSGVVIKKPELAVRRSNALDFRLECEGVVALCSAEAGATDTRRLLNASIAKGLGVKGRSKYLASIDTSVVSGFDALVPKVQEAALAAWSSM